MFWLASFIMRRPLNAVLVASVFAVLSIVIPPFSLLSGAAVSLVVLRLGIGMGAKVMLGAGLVVAIIAFVGTGGTASAIAGFVLMAMAVTWLPLLLLSWVLYETRSLSITMIVAAILAMVAVVVMYLLVGDTSLWWRQALDKTFVMTAAGANLPLSPEDLGRALDALSQVMTGLLGATVLLSLIGSVFLARWWQSLLYNRGGFRSEFLALRLDYRLSIIVLLVLSLMLITNGIWAQLAGDLLIVLLALYMLVGLALVHSLVALTGAHVAILFALYLLLAFLLPQMMIFLAAAGYIDSWLNLRVRVGAQGKNSNDKSGDNGGDDE